MSNLGQVSSLYVALFNHSLHTLISVRLGASETRWYGAWFIRSAME